MPKARARADNAQGVLDFPVAAKARAAKAVAAAAPRKSNLAVVPETCRRHTAPAPSPSRWRDGVATAAMFIGALGLAGVSATFSIVGLTAIFAGAFWSVAIMGGALEIGKLSAVAWFGRRHRAPLVLKAAIGALVVTLMVLNSIGSYGYLAHANINHAVSGEVAISDHTADVHARMQVEAGILADLDKKISQIDSAVAEATRRGRISTAMALAEQQGRHRTELAADRVREAKKLAALQIEAATVAGERTQLAADSGPVRYLAALLGIDDTALLRIFIGAIAALLDPLAVLLLLGATFARREDAP